MLENTPQTIGRSRGGLTTKIHATVEALGNPLRLRLSAGEVADISEAPTPSFARSRRKALRRPFRCAAIVSNSENMIVISIKYRNLVERFVNRLKQFRCIATRYEQLAQNFFSMLNLVCAYIWLA